jgi:DUF4097 and DUF4098 domain-containing protein YvlB
MPNERTLSVAGHTELSVSTRSGRVVIEAEERRDLYLESDAPLRDDKIDVDSTGRVSVKSARGGSGWLQIRCPTGTDLVIGTVSGKVELRGQFGAVRVTTVSGSVNVERAEELDVRTISGNIEVERCTGRSRLQTKSGRATCGLTGDALVSTMSGQIRVDEATGKVRAQSASGKIEVGTRGNGDVAVQTMSGAVRVEVPKGVRPHTRLQSLTGSPRCDCEEGEDCEIAVRSLSGKIEVVPE